MTLAAITMTAPEAASPVQMYRATYSPDDNKLRLYAASRLDPETYKKVHDAGFRWAPRQALFVAPAWTPGREDVLLSLAGEIEDEDSTLAERQEARAERFTGYSGKRASESAQALDEVERLAAMIPPGQPILVGHHSERRARRDAQRIENGMKRAVMLFERAEYWEERARSALLHAKYLRENFNGVRVQCGDFMEWQPVQYYSRIIMNPPFIHGQDIRHILRAFSLLRPGGVLVAVCLNGPRQQEKLLPFSDIREELPRGTFAYTDVPTMIIRLRA
ncbi:DUF3560 domain-containing protein [Escherichia coli]|nr:DUF3560 domain-containing protein [Escherichia coli]